MPEDIATYIVDRMPTLYQTVSQAVASLELVGIMEAPEAAMRSAWDNVLKAMWCPMNSVSTTFMYVFNIGAPTMLLMVLQCGKDYLPS